MFVKYDECWIIYMLTNDGTLSLSGGYGVATGGPLAWGLCYNKEMSPSQSYCDDFYKYTYPCAPGAQYYGRGAIPIYWYAMRISLWIPQLQVYIL